MTPEERQRAIKAALDSSYLTAGPGRGRVEGLPEGPLNTTLLGLGKALRGSGPGNILTGGLADWATQAGYGQAPGYGQSLMASFDLPTPAKAFGLTGAALGATLPKVFGGDVAKAAGKLGPGAKQAGMFLGEGAKTADKGMLALAKEAEDRGLSMPKIFDATGWFRGPDGKWRFETSDEGFQYLPEALKEGAEGSRSGLLQASADNPPLFEAYPGMAEIPITHRPDETRYLGGYVDPRVKGNPERIITGQRGDRRSVAHEMQHGVQARENFAAGGSPRMFAPGNPQTMKAIEAAKMDPQVRNLREQAFDLMADGNEKAARAKIVESNKKAQWVAYRRLAGETEARNTAGRLDLTADDRRMLPPWETQDVPYPDQLTAGKGLPWGVMQDMVADETVLKNEFPEWYR